MQNYPHKTFEPMAHYRTAPDISTSLNLDSDNDTDDDNTDSDSDSDSDSECTTVNYKKVEFIGLKQLATILGSTANKFHKWCDRDISLQLYLDAILIDPYSQWLANLGILYETKFKDDENAITYYKRAIEEGDVLAMFNLADLYQNCNEFTLMTKYYEMAALTGDIESIKQLVMHSFKYKQVELFSKHYFHYLNIAEDDENPYYEDNHKFNHFLQTNNSLSVIMSLQTFIDSNDTTTQSLILINHLRKLPIYSIYKNKISLFTRLNCIEECKICYDTKLNIDIHCGHTVCTDCYTKIYNKDCPFCRISPTYFYL